MDGLPLTSMTTEELLATAQADLASAVANADSVKTELVTMTNKASELEAAVASAISAKADLEAKVASVSQELDLAKSKILELEAKDTKAERKAASIASACGVAPVAVTPTSAPAKSREEAISELSKISDPIEKQKFFAQHQKVLLGI